MQKYIFKRIIQSIITIFLIVVIVFFLVRLTGDPVAMMVSPDAEESDVQILKEKFGLDQSIFIQLIVFLKSAAKGDFGESFKWQEPALKLVLSRFPATLELAVSAGCDFIVTYNRLDFEGTEKFGIEVVTPKEFLQGIGELP